MKTKPYKGKSLNGAIRRIRELQRAADAWQKIAERFDAQRRTLAMLCADGPAFDNPMLAMLAKTLRNEILAKMGMNQDGTFKNKEVPA